MSHKRIFLSPPYVGQDELSQVTEAFSSGYIAPCGPMVDIFEQKLARLSDRKYAVAVSSATAALELVLAEKGVDFTWTVIAPTLTFIATVGPAYRCGAHLVFVDCDASGNIDCSLLECALKDAVAENRRIMFIGVDLYGRCCDYDTIERLCVQYGAEFICDSAEAVGASYKSRPSGSAGVAAVYSFNGNKIITTSGGGAVLTDNADMAEHIRKLSQQSRENTLWYEHKEVGYNFRLSNILAAIGVGQLEKLGRIIEKKTRNRKFYTDIAKRKGYEMLPAMQGENNWLSVMFLSSEQERNKLLSAFDRANIEARPVWKPMHLQPVFSGCRIYGGLVSDDMFKRGVCLPSGAGLEALDFERIEKVFGII